MSDFTDHSSLYHLRYEILGVRLGFDVLSLRVLVHHLCLVSRFQVKDILSHFGQCTLVVNATSNYFDSYRYACETRVRWRTYKEFMSNRGYVKIIRYTKSAEWSVYFQLAPTYIIALDASRGSCYDNAHIIPAIAQGLAWCQSSFLSCFFLKILKTNPHSLPPLYPAFSSQCQIKSHSTYAFYHQSHDEPQYKSKL